MAKVHFSHDIWDDSIPDQDIPSTAASKAKREHYLAQKARLDVEKLEGTLVPVRSVEVALFNTGRAVREALLNFPVKIVDQIMSLHPDDPDRRHKILIMMEQEINQALLELSGELDLEGEGNATPNR